MITVDEKGVTSKISIHAEISWLRGQIPVRCDFKLHGKSLCQKTSPVEFESKYFHISVSCSLKVNVFHHLVKFEHGVDGQRNIFELKYL